VPASKLTLSRYQIINTCLVSKVKKYWSLTELLERLAENDIAISSRTLELDFEAMRFDQRLGYFAPIKYCPVNRGYYYADEGYSINKINLSEEEIETLFIASDLMKPYDNLSVLKNFQSIVYKIVASVNACKLRQDGQLLPDISCDSAPKLETAEALNLLLKALREKIVVRLTFRFERNEGIETEDFHPLHIHECNGEWYVAGMFEPDMEFGLLEVTLIESVKLSSRMPDRERVYKLAELMVAD
jgi:predicted DNA-binding transcriptional regulator YafY